ncbi:putative iq calmodulin-binding motif family protein [Paratrimastix pyriformis]|uniref:Iq calmodulin-binding motif family protein n=1 Tax=Paratrimastix pyriformis TaxID=342808 RepID=A0ABQ8UXF1_9EUKA|nr:putative iq calmodulin-binding motif family protein [Paratrimastix pyriformis]
MRGYRARKEYVRMLQEKCRAERQEYFDQVATKIQRVFRGWYSRKYVADFYERKRYLRAIQEKNEEVAKQLGEFEQQQRTLHLQRTEMGRYSRFASAAQSLHHLVSTQTQPGIYASPYQALRQGGPPTVFGQPVEMLLEESAKSLIRQQQQQRSLTVPRKPGTPGAARSPAGPQLRTSSGGLPGAGASRSIRR